MRLTAALTQGLYTCPFPLRFVFSSLQDPLGLLRQDRRDEHCLYILEIPIAQSIAKY
jgi:hypothetical protein